MRTALTLSIVLSACGDNASDTDVLLFSRTLGYRHQDSIELSLAILPDKLREKGFTVTATEDPAKLEDLSNTRVVVFLYTTGNDILETAGKRELERFIRADGGWVGIHSAADTEYEWPFYQELVVGHFGSHPAIQPASIDVLDTTHPVMTGVPMRWDAEDEWYNFLREAGSIAGVTVHANLDESSYTGGDMGAKHPIIWSHERFTGRAVYSGIGHVAARWQDEVYLNHILAMIEWASADDPMD
ncbi:MAG: ThuA domain-containing protein [Kofleriaceae bacterium]